MAAMILIVDDEESVLEIGAEFLSRAGFEVIAATGGPAGIAAVENRGDEIDAPGSKPFRGVWDGYLGGPGADAEAIATWAATDPPSAEVSFTPARVLLQDFTGVPAIVDLAAMRDAMSELGGDPAKINPLLPAELVIDHSVQVDHFGTPGALSENNAIEFGRNKERYSFLRWGQKAFDNFRVVPPATGIVHQVNIEYLSSVVFTQEVNGVFRAYPDTVVGTDSHTTMVLSLINI